MQNVYIHIPFCAQNCSYCTFAKELSVDGGLHQQYIEMLKQEFKSSKYLKKGERIKTLYFGGGTPSLLSSDLYRDLFSFLNEHYVLDKGVEICLEAHPLTVEEEKLSAWKNLGVNRISLGVQTFQKKFDVFLERNLSDTQRAYDLLRQSGLDVSVDMIFGFPGQTEQDLLKDLEIINQLSVEHISYYALDYKPNSKIEAYQEQGLSFDVFEKYYDLICKSLSNSGVEQYELYNFAKLGVRSKHNYNFWENEDYIGFGVSAVSQVGKNIKENTVNLKTYLAGEFASDIYELDSHEYTENFLKRSLRLVKGLKKHRLKEFLGENIKNSQNAFDTFEENMKTVPSWVIEKEEKVFLTQEGRMFFEDVIEVLCEDLDLLIRK